MRKCEKYVKNDEYEEMKIMKWNNEGEYEEYDNEKMKITKYERWMKIM